MGTTMHFERKITDAAEGKNEVVIEVGHSSPLGQQQMYLRIDGKWLTLNEQDARDLSDAIHSVAFYLGYTD